MLVDGNFCSRLLSWKWKKKTFCLPIFILLHCDPVEIKKILGQALDIQKGAARPV
jgi:hypothetical protein